MKHLIARVSVLAVLGVFLVAAAQARPAGQQQQPATPGESQAGAPDDTAPAGPVVTEEEYEEYTAFYDARGDNSMIIQLGEAFLVKYPDSHYVGPIYSQLTTAYLHTNQEDKMFVAGGKALEFDPDGIDVLSVLAWAIPRRVNSDMPDGPQQLQKAEDYAHRAIQLLDAMVKPDDLDAAAFESARNEKLSMSYSGLGTAEIKRGKYTEAGMALDKAVQLAPSPDPVDLYLLGLADQTNSYFTPAIAAFTQCADIPGPMQALCKSGIEDTQKKAKEGLEAPK